MSFVEAGVVSFVEVSDVSFVEVGDVSFVETGDVSFAEAGDVSFVQAPKKKMNVTSATQEGSLPQRSPSCVGTKYIILSDRSPNC